MNQKNQGNFFAIFSLAMLQMFLLLSNHAGAAVNPTVRLENYSLSQPQPLEPGSVATLSLHFKSLEYDVCAERVAVQLSVSYPLSVRGSDAQYIDLLCSNNDYGNSTAYFQLAVDPLAQPGTYPVVVGTTYEKSFLKFTASNAINLRVQGKPEFEAAVASSQPADVYAGDSAAITVKFANNGTGRADSAVATLSTAAAGIEVKWAGATALLGTIQPRASADAKFQIEAPKNAFPGRYPLVAALSYTSEDGSRQTREFKFVLPLKPKAEFEASVPASALVAIGEKQVVAVRLANAGSEQARKLKATLVPTYPFSTDGTVRYVESLAPGQATELGFVVSADKEASEGKQLLKLSLEYENAQGKKFSDTTDFSLGARPKGLAEQAAGYWWAAALAVLAAIVFARRKMAKRKQ